MSASLERLPNKPRISADEVGELVVHPRIEVSKIFGQPELSKYRVGRRGAGERGGGWAQGIVSVWQGGKGVPQRWPRPMHALVPCLP